jgi:NADH/NAD ratio-sensing transcriptional regulator Rex
METLKKISQIRKSKEEYNGKPEEIVFVFSGALGENLVKEPNFAGSAVKILAAFTDKPIQSDFYEVFEMEKLQNLVPRLDVKTAILCVPHRQAAKMVERLISSGITRIWNWSGNILTSDTVEICNEELEADILGPQN